MYRDVSAPAKFLKLSAARGNLAQSHSQGNLAREGGGGCGCGGECV